MRNYNYKKQKSSILINGPFLLTVLAIFFANNLFGQISGTIAIPSANYPTIKVAVDSLNLYGIAGGGGVTFNVAAGYTETFAATVVMTATGTSSDQIIFQKSGGGANPLITAPVGNVTFAVTSTTLDGIWAFSGSDYVTINGIDLVDNNTMPASANSNMPDFMEYGYGFFKASATDGCQNNTIKNCTVSLNRFVSVSGPAFNSSNINGSSGILMLPSAIGSIATTITPTAATGSNSNNKFYTNTLQKSNQGICMFGYAAAAPFTLGDQNNDIGGSSLATGNNIINFGGTTNNYFAATSAVAVGYTFVTSTGNVYRVSVAGTLGTTAPSGTAVATPIVNGSATVYFLHSSAPANGVIANAQWGLNVSYNTINNNSGGLGYQQVFNHARGIFSGPATSASATISNNSITIQGASATNFVEGIENQAGSTSASNTIAITNNTITLNQGLSLTSTAPTFTVNPTGNHYGIWNNAATPANLTISGNIFTNWSTYTTAATIYEIYNSGITGSSYTVSNNTLGNISFPNAAAYSQTLYLCNATSTTTGAFTLQNNTVNNISFTTTSSTSANIYMFYIIGSPSTELIDNNRLVNLNLNFSGSQYTIYDLSSAQLSKTITNNGITGTLTRTGVAGTTYLMYSSASTLTGASYTVSGNNWSNITANTLGTGTLYCMYNSDFSTSPYVKKNIFNNTFQNINYNGNGQCYLGYCNGLGDGNTTSGSNVYNNLFDNISFGGLLYGLNTGSIGSPTTAANVYNNQVSNITSTGATSTIYGAYLSAPAGGVNFYKNKIFNVSETGSGAGVAYGVYTAASIPYTIYNNTIGDIKAPNSNVTGTQPSAVGMYAASGTFVNVYDNTVYLSAGTTSTGANWGSAAIFASTSPLLTLRNNIFINNSTPKGTGKAAAYQRGSNILASYGTASDNNLFYCGTPGINNLIYYDGFANDQTIGQYKQRIYPIDANSVTENTTFLSTTGTSANYLHVDGTVASFTESGGVNIAGITDDYDAQTRQGNGGYAGTGTAPDIGADEYSGIAIAPPAAPINFTYNTATTNSFNITFDDNSIGEYGFVVSRSLYIGGPYTAIANVVSTSAATVGTTYTLPQTGLPGNATYYYQIVSYSATTSPILPGVASTLPCGSGLSGTFSIPTNYASITAAITALNTNGMTGPVILELEPSYTSALEPSFPVTITNTIGCLGLTNTLTIRPQAAVSSTLTITSANALATIDINGANFVTIDGRPGGAGTTSMLNIINTNAAGVAIRITNDASNNTITYCDVQGQNTVSVPTLTVAGGVIFINSANATNLMGNDNNTISNCNVHGTGPAAANFPAIGIAAFGTVTTAVSHNDNCTITNCNIYDYHHAISAASGIKIDAGNTAWNITNNHFYQTTALNVTTSSATYRALWVTPNAGAVANASTANGFVITGNYIGGNNASGSGTYSMTGTGNYNFYGMDIFVGLGTATSIQNNTLTNWNMTVGFPSNAVYGINIGNGNANVGTVTGNLVGSTTTNGAITVTATASGGAFVGFRSNTGGTINFSNNTVSGIDVVGNATTVATAFTGINTAGGLYLTINNNTVGSATLANSINMVSTSSISSTAVAVRGIWSSSTNSGVTNSITNNLVANINTNNNATGSQGTTLIGIAATSGINTISGNTVRNLSSAGQTTPGGATQAVLGILYSSISSPSLISNNTIHSLKLTNPTTTVATQIGGIFFNGPQAGTHTIERNFIHSISIASPTDSAGVITGIDIGTTSGVTITVQNNMIRLGYDEAGASVVTPCSIRGIVKNNPNSNIWFNSIYIGGTNVGAKATNTFALTRTAAATDNWRNNILVNNRSNATTGGKHYAISLSSASTLTLDYNDYYGTGTGYIMGANGGDVATFTPNWVAGDAHSYDGDPLFINPTGTSATVDLHIDPVNATIIEQTGIPIAAVTNDFDNQTRSALTPADMGADAGNFASLVCNGLPVAGTSAPTQSGAVCISGTKILKLTGYTNVPGITLQWQESNVSGGPYTDVIGGSGATAATYTTATLTANKYYVCLVICVNGGFTAQSNETAVLVDNPQVVSAPSVARCGAGTVTLCATGSPNTNINWYTAPTGGLVLSNPYSNVMVTGFNDDIVANGVGTSSVDGVTNAAIGVDGAGYTFIDNTFKYVSTNSLPACYMPVNKLVPSLLTPGLIYQLQDYGVSSTPSPNALTIANQSTTYTSPWPSSQSLTLVTPASFGSLKVLYESIVNVSPMTVDATVTFTDATTQTFTGNACANWFTPSSVAYSGMGRTTSAGVIQCGATPNMFELNLPLSAANQAKLVQSITFSIPTVLTSGTFSYNINYFHAMAVGGNAPATPGCFTTPVISSNATYYVSASIGGTDANVGKSDFAFYSNASNLNTYGLQFDALSNFTLKSVVVYPNSASNGVPGAITIGLTNSAGTVLQQATVNVTAYNQSSSASPQTVNLNFQITAGSGYRLVMTSAPTGGITVCYQYGGGTIPYGYPYTVPGAVSITNGLLNGASNNNYYYFFYNWLISTGCESPRTPVLASVSNPPAFSVTTSQTVCNNTITMLNVTTPAANYDSIKWAPITNLYLDAAATIPYTGGNEDTVYFRSATQSANTFTCTANNTLSPYCGNSATTTVNVQPAAASITLSQASLCFGGTVALGLNPASPYAAGSIQWQVSADNSSFSDIAGQTSSTYNTPFADTTMYYNAVIKNSSNGVCFTANTTVLVTEPVLLTTTDASSCTPGSLTLGATASAGATVMWYATASGGGSIATGNSYTTPVLNASATYYVSALQGIAPTNVGKSDFVYYSTSSLANTYGEQFDAVSPFTLYSVVVYPNAVSPTAGTITIGLTNSAGTILQQATVNVTGYNQSTTPTPQTVNLNFSVPAGVGYRLVLLNASSGISLCYQSNGSVSTPYPYPYTVPGTLSITNAIVGGTSYSYYYYYFYNWSVSTGCESSRVPVTAAISTVPNSITISTNPAVTCTPGQTVALSVASSNGVLAAGGSWEYQWMDETGTTVLQAWSASSTFSVTAVSGLNKYRIYMRNSACPGSAGFDYASFIVGISGSAIGVSPTSCSGTGSIVVNAQGSGVLTNWYSNDFASPTLGAAAAVTDNAAITGGQCVLTPNTASNKGAFQVVNLGGISAANYAIDFDLGVLPSGTEGFSYSFGDDVSATATAPNFECGTGTKFKLTFDANPNAGGNVAGIYLMYNCNADLQPPSTPGVLAYVNNTSWLNANTHVNIVIDASGFVTVKLNGIPVINNVQLPAAYLTANRSTWTHVFKARSGSISEMHTIDNLAIKYNAFEYSVNGPAGPWQASNAFNSLPVGAYSVWVRNPADTTCMANLGSFSLTYPTSVTTKATDTTLCVSGATTLSMSPALAGATYQWDSSSVSSSGPWFPITGATSATYLANITTTTWYHCNISCGGTPIPGSPSIPRQVLVYNPQIVSVDLSQATRCGLGSVTLGATGNAGSTINWYAAASGGAPIGTGNSFTTPAIAASKNYYATAVIGAINGNAGKTDFAYYSNTNGANTFGLTFDALQNFTLNSVVVYPYSSTNGTAGTLTIGIANSAGTVLTQTTVNVTGYIQSATPTPQTVNLNLSVTAGSGYRLVLIGTTGVSGLCYQYSGGAGSPYPYPYTIPSVLSITSGMYAGTLYNYYYVYFYNWSVSSGCESPRTLVPATVNAPPPVTINASSTTICSGSGTTLTALCPSNPNYTYSWTPGNLPGASVTVNPIVTTKYTVTATDNSGGTNFGCVDTETVTINVNPIPPVVTVTPANPILCGGGSQLLTANVATLPPFTITGTSPATSSTPPQPFYRAFEGFRQQYLIRGTELTATGVVAGNITSITFNVSTLGATYPQWNHDGYTIKIGATASADLSGGWESSPSVVFGPVNYSPTSGANTFLFSSPFTWNGTSNIVVEICYDNDPNNTCSTGAPICSGNDATCDIATASFVSASRYYAADNNSAARDICSYTATGTTQSTRPVMTFNFAGIPNFTWAPASSLNVSTGASVLASPTAATVYTVTATNTFGCTRTATNQVLITPRPHPYLQEGDSVLCSNDQGFYIHVLDNVSYSGGYPSGTTFDFYGAGGILYQSSTDNFFFNANNSDAFYAVVTLPGYLGSCAAISDTSVMDFGNTQAPQYLLTTDSVRCYGESNGKAIAEITFGGTPRFRWQWYNSSHVLVRDYTGTTLSDTLTGMPEGMYTIVITDHQDSLTSPYCSVTDSIFIGQPEAPLGVTENTGNHVDVLCNGAQTGAINIDVTGGTEPYSYNWSHSASSEDLTGTGAGTYTCTVTDARGCTVVITSSITEPSAIVISSTVNQIQCNGGTGSVTISVTGGVGSYSYEWSNSSFVSSNTGLTAGTYTVTVTDGNGCTKSATFIIETEPTAVTASCSATPVSCFGGNNGTVGVTADGGTPGYTYSWSNGSTSASQTSLVKGIYTVTVTDAHGCTASCSTSVTQPLVLAVTTASVNPTSGLPNSGTINVNATGGTTAYSYQWNNGSTAQNRTGLAAGTYTVTVTDANDCSASRIVTLTYTCQLGYINTVVTKPSCGKDNGVATVTGTGGTSYTYAWQTTPVQTTATATGLSYYYNSYCLITDVTTGCSFMDTVVKPTSNGLTLVLSSPAYAGGYNIRCNGGSTGSISLTVTGSTGPYTYLWNNGATTQNLTNVPAGSYMVTVSNGGCTNSNMITLTQPAVMVATATGVNPACFGGSNGSATVTASGGAGPYTYSWNTSPVKTSATATGLTSGVYIVTVSDANGCTKTALVTLTQPATGVSVSGVVTNVNCNGGSTGSIDITPSGGTPAYTYLWTGGVTTQDRINALAAGTYTVTVTDSKGCTAQYSNTITQPTAITATATTTNVNCNGGSNGTGSVTASGGTPPYTYSWNTTPPKSGANVNGIKKGTYTVLITDSKGCVKAITVTITEPAAIVIGISKTNVTTAGGSNGTATANVSGGVSPYSYSWNTTPVKSTQTATGLIAGTYTVTVTDANGCTKTASVVITQPTARMADGTDNNAASNSVVFPNPSTGKFTVTFDETIRTDVNLQVINMTGERVFMKDFDVSEQSNSFSIDLGALPKGIYFIRYRTNEKDWIDKLVIR